VTFWGVQELADLLGVAKTWVYDRTREHGPDLIPHIKLGKYIRFDPESPAFVEWLQSHEVRGVLGPGPPKWLT
jgi:Helix-turn-helix domain